jgi:hypothetical protein
MIITMMTMIMIIVILFMNDTNVNDGNPLPLLRLNAIVYLRVRAVRYTMYVTLLLWFIAYGLLD